MTMCTLGKSDRLYFSTIQVSSFLFFCKKTNVQSYKTQALRTISRTSLPSGQNQQKTFFLTEETPQVVTQKTAFHCSPKRSCCQHCCQYRLPKGMFCRNKTHFQCDEDCALYILPQHNPFALYNFKTF